MGDAGLGIFQFLVELAGIHQLAVYFDSLEQSVKNILPIIGVITCIYGVLQCFLGYKLFKFWCGVVGLIVGVMVGDAIASSGILTNTPGAYLLGLLIILFMAIIGAFVAYRAYMVGLFLYAFAAAFSVVFLLVAVISSSMTASLVIGIIAGLALGVVAVVFKRFWIIVSTSIYGGISICTGMMMILLSSELGWFFILAPAFAIAGFIVQEKTTKKHIKPSHAASQQPYAENVPYGENPSNAENPSYAENPPNSEVPSYAETSLPVDPHASDFHVHGNPAHPLQPNAAPENPPQPPQD